MKKIYTTAMGKSLDIESLRASHEETIAVGNMKVNARGDVLGPGGVVETPRGSAMKDYYRLAEASPTSVEDKIARQRAAGARVKKQSVAKRTEKSRDTVVDEVSEPAEEPIVRTPQQEFVMSTTQPESDIPIDDTPENDTPTNDISENSIQPLFATNNNTYRKNNEPEKPIIETVDKVNPIEPPSPVTATSPVPSSAQIESNPTAPANNEASPKKMRGSLADSIAKQTTVTQTKMPDPRKPKGISRI